MQTGATIDQPRVHPHSAVVTLDAAFDHVPDAEFRRDRAAHRPGTPSIGHGRLAGGHEEARHPRQGIGRFFGQPSANGTLPIAPGDRSSVRQHDDRRTVTDRGQRPRFRPSGPVLRCRVPAAAMPSDRAWPSAGRASLAPDAASRSSPPSQTAISSDGSRPASAHRFQRNVSITLEQPWPDRHVLRECRSSQMCASSLYGTSSIKPAFGDRVRTPHRYKAD